MCSVCKHSIHAGSGANQKADVEKLYTIALLWQERAMRDEIAINALAMKIANGNKHEASDISFDALYQAEKQLHAANENAVYRE